MEKKPRLGFLGTGVMGGAMAGHLLDAGHSLTVFTRSRSKAEPLLSRGAVWAESPRALAQASDIVFSIVGYPSDVEEVILGPEGVLAGLAPGGISCDMTTSSPDLARRIAAAARKMACHGADAPVTGGDVGARKASLSIFVGAEKDVFARILPILELMGKKILLCGPPGSGQQAKLANQVAVAGVMFSVCESLLFAQQTGLEVARWFELVEAGAAGSAAMSTLGRRLLAHDYEPGFFIEHFVKDLRLCLEECRRMGLVLPGLALAEEFYSAMLATGCGKQGTQALIDALARFSGKEWRRCV